jgi:hypothetical protein
MWGPQQRVEVPIFDLRKLEIEDGRMSLIFKEKMFWSRQAFERKNKRFIFSCRKVCL